MELNDDILVQTTSPQTIARIKRVKSQLHLKYNLVHQIYSATVHSNFSLTIYTVPGHCILRKLKKY